MACTQQFGGPETATVTGTLHGDEVAARFSRENGCEISRWEKVAELLGGRRLSTWRVTVRTGPKVERVRAATLEEALDALELHARARRPTAERRDAVDLRVRRFEPGRPGRRARRAARAGARARRRRRPRRRLASRPGPAACGAGASSRSDGEDAYAALRRALLRARASSRSGAASARARASPGTRDSSSAQKRGEWSITSRWQTSCSTT